LEPCWWNGRLGTGRLADRTLTREYNPTETPISTSSSPPVVNIKWRYNTFVHALAFVLGFSLIFIVGWGGTATIFGQFFAEYKKIIGQIGGLVVIGFGLMTLGVVKIPWLNMDSRPEWKPTRRYGLVSSGLMGIFFAAGWTPCIGTTLGAILTMGFSQETSTKAMLLSSGYALGLGIPFLLIGISMDRALEFIRRLRRYQHAVQLGSGMLLITIGLLLVTGRMTMIAIWAQQHGYYFDLPLGGAAAPSYLIAIFAGMLSFLSPCVLPLVPAYVGYLSGQMVRSGEKLP
jgi:cytochrome c-type biogenesis protein